MHCETNQSHSVSHQWSFMPFRYISILPYLIPLLSISQQLNAFLFCAIAFLLESFRFVSIANHIVTNHIVPLQLHCQSHHTVSLSMRCLWYRFYSMSFLGFSDLCRSISSLSFHVHSTAPHFASNPFQIRATLLFACPFRLFA